MKPLSGRYVKPPPLPLPAQRAVVGLVGDRVGERLILVVEALGGDRQGVGLAHRATVQEAPRRIVDRLPHRDLHGHVAVVRAIEAAQREAVRALICRRRRVGERRRVVLEFVVLERRQRRRGPDRPAPRGRHRRPRHPRSRSSPGSASPASISYGSSSPPRAFRNAWHCGRLVHRRDDLDRERHIGGHRSVAGADGEAVVPAVGRFRRVGERDAFIELRRRSAGTGSRGRADRRPCTWAWRLHPGRSRTHSRNAPRRPRPRTRPSSSESAAPDRKPSHSGGSLTSGTTVTSNSASVSLTPSLAAHAEAVGPLVAGIGGVGERRSVAGAGWLELLRFVIAPCSGGFETEKVRSSLSSSRAEDRSRTPPRRPRPHGGHRGRGRTKPSDAKQDGRSFLGSTTSTRTRTSVFAVPSLTRIVNSSGPR